MLEGPNGRRDLDGMDLDGPKVWAQNFGPIFGLITCGNTVFVSPNFGPKDWAFFSPNFGVNIRSQPCHLLFGPAINAEQVETETK